MRVSCEIRMEYPDERTASAIFESVKTDNEGFVESQLAGKHIIFTASAESAMSLSHTINDLLACVKAAENSLL